MYFRSYLLFVWLLFYRLVLSLYIVTAHPCCLHCNSLTLKTLLGCRRFDVDISISFLVMSPTFTQEYDGVERCISIQRGIHRNKTRPSAERVKFTIVGWLFWHICDIIDRDGFVWSDRVVYYHRTTVKVSAAREVRDTIISIEWVYYSDTKCGSASVSVGQQFD